MGRFPDVSVVIVNYNGRKYLYDCLSSLSTLDYPGDKLEILLVDNGSSDGSGEYVARHFPDVRLLRLPQNMGFARGNNIGVQAAQGEYVAFLNTDMRVDPGWLTELVRVVQSESDVVCVGSKILSWDGNALDFAGGALNFYGMGFQPEESPSGEADTPYEVLFACGGAMLINRQVFLESGGFDENYFAYFEDVDLGWRLWLLGYRVLLAPRSIAFHHGHATGKRFASEKRALLYERNALYTVIKNYESRNLSRILPVALLLTAKRAVVFSHCDKRTFRMESEPPPHSIWPASRGPAPLAMGHLRREFRQLLDEFGPWAVFKEAVRRGLRWIYTRTVLQVRRDVALVPRVALSPLMALDDVAEALPQIWARREEIQRRRVRSDAEILPLFRAPFHPHPPDPAYLELQQRLAHLFQIDALFEEATRNENAGGRRLTWNGQS